MIFRIVVLFLVFCFCAFGEVTDVPFSEFDLSFPQHELEHLSINDTQFDSLVAELSQLPFSGAGSVGDDVDRQGMCSRTYIRKEFRDMTKKEWVRFKKALLQLMEGNSGFIKTNNIDLPSPLSITFWTRLHLSSVPYAHGTPQFFPWHRLFIFKFEQALRTIDPQVTLPYWDWSIDSSNPASSPIWALKYLGNVYSEKGDCKNFPLLLSPELHCLRRRKTFSSDIRRSKDTNSSPFYSAKTLRAIVGDATLSYDRFRAMIELAPHNIVHLAVGGPDGDMSFMSSPNDPIFWLHHTFIDKLWADRQLLIKRTNGFDFAWTDYDGKHPSTGMPVSLGDRLRPFNERVGDTMDSRSAPFCYIYAPPKKALASLASRLNNTEDSIIQRVPEPIPNSWLRLHHFNSSEVREVESILAAIMAREMSN